METIRRMQALFALIACLALGSPALAQEAWSPIADDTLGELRGGLRVNGMDVSLEVLVRDLVDGREVLRKSFAVGSFDTMRDALVLPPLVNTRDGTSLRRETTARVRVQGYRDAFGAASKRSVRERIQRSLR